MTGLVDLDNKFIMPDFFNIDILENLPIHKHVYGQPMDPDPKTLYWTEYQYAEGMISFARKLYIEYPEVAKYIVSYMKTLFPNVLFDYQRVGLLKTRGDVTPHCDESNRKCCINIGIKNSSSAITKTSKLKVPEYTRELFEEVCASNRCQDGSAYLLDTSSVHEVISLDLTVNRYLFTYGFGRSFEEIYSQYNGI